MRAVATTVERKGRQITTRVSPTGRVCTKCVEFKPWSAFGPIKHGVHGHTAECLECRYARKRAHEQLLDGDPDYVPPPDSPDSSPARRLRCRLVACRELGHPFDDAWPHAVERALKGLGVTEQQDWASSFSWSRPTWRAAYERSEMPFRCSALFLSDD